MKQSNGDGRPFAGIKVIDLTHVLADPTALISLPSWGRIRSRWSRRTMAT